jgi:hypothetical protein
MDLRCPKCNSTDLKQVSLADEEGFYQSDKRAQFRGVLVGSGGPVVLVGTSTTKGTKQTGLTAQIGGGGDMSNLQAYFSAAYCPSRHSSFKSPSRRSLLEVCWLHASKIVWRLGLFGPYHEIE